MYYNSFHHSRCSHYRGKTVFVFPLRSAEKLSDARPMQTNFDSNFAQTQASALKLPNGFEQCGFIRIALERTHIRRNGDFEWAFLTRKRNTSPHVHHTKTRITSIRVFIACLRYLPSTCATSLRRRCQLNIERHGSRAWMRDGHSDTSSIRRIDDPFD